MTWDRARPAEVTWARDDPADLASRVEARLGPDCRLAGLFASAHPGGSRLTAVLAAPGGYEVVEAELDERATSYPALSAKIASAGWYEREIHDLFGLVPTGHPRLDPLLLPLAEPAFPRPRPGRPYPADLIEPSEAPLPIHVVGEGTFTIPYGPVRSGVFESVEYLVETPGEDIAHLRTRIFHKHRGVEKRFETLPAADGALLAERVEGVASVAHAMAFCQAMEGLDGTEVPERAELVRVLHAELERVANHLDSIIRHTEASGQAVAFARMTLHKERLMRLRAELCGSRFGRGVVVPGGVSGPPLVNAGDTISRLGQLREAIGKDTQLLMQTPSFLDRLRGTGQLAPELAAEHGALGPVGRGSASRDDTRLARPYGAYDQLGLEAPRTRQEGDALARQHVRLEEIDDSFALARRAARLAGQSGGGPWKAEAGLPDGRSLAWVEAPQGELLYLVEAQGGRLVRVKARTASYHNLELFHLAFRGDIFTDFAFIEASFGLSIAGAAL